MRTSVPTAIGALVAALLPISLIPLTSSAADLPQHDVVITGVGVTPTSTWPTYDAAVDRYAVATTSATGGSLTLTATTTDPAGVVRLDGRVATGPVTVNGLASGDEVNVQITDSAGTSNQSFVYLPVGFPRMTATSSGAGPTPGYVFLTTTGFFAPEKFETVVDRFGVPIYVNQHINPMDLKLQPNGHYSVARGLTGQLDSTFDIVELNNRFEPIASYTNPPPLQNTEFHDSILLPSGGRILMAYEHAASPSTDIDSVVQEVNPDGTKGLTWSTAGNTLPVDRLTNLHDYAHLNSVEIMADGNLLLSFRHLSQVMKVDRQSGEVIWRLGGPRSTFAFSGDPLGGPCAQHTARELANGDIQIWDNGSKVTSTTLQPMCPNPDSPTWPPVVRELSRVVTYRLDETTDVATMVDEYRPFNGDSFSEFAGSAQRLGAGTLNDNVLLGLALAQQPSTGAEQPDVLEIDKDDNVVWSLDIPGVFSYRAAKFPAPDAIAPELTVSGVTDGTTYAAGDAPTLSYGCTDRGGSNLDACVGTVPSGATVPMTPGAHTVTVTATDRAGNTTTRTIGYSVTAAPQPPVTQPPVTQPPYRPDARVKRVGHGWVGDGIVGPTRHQTVRFTVGPKSVGDAWPLVVRVRNDGTRADRFEIDGTGGSRAFRVRYRSGADVTDKVRNGLLTPRLLPGQTYQLRLLVTRTRDAAPGDRRRIVLVATSRHDTDARDKVAVVVKAG